MRLKHLFVIMSLAFSSATVAQTAVTAPTAPTITSPVTVSPNAATALSSSTTNSVFIDQSGANPNVNITQDGDGNKQGSANRPIYLRGIDQTVVTKQTGDNNEINLEVVNATTGNNVGASVTVQQIGNTNEVDAACGYGNASDGTTALTGCKAADLNWKFTGNSNKLQFRGTGEDVKSAATVTGNSNVIRVDSIGNKHTQTLVVAGDSNEFNINQRSTGSSGSSTVVDVTGNGSIFNVSQTGTVDNVLNIKSVGTNGTWNITQKN